MELGSVVAVSMVVLFDAALATSPIAVTHYLVRSNLREKELSLGKMWWQEARACGYLQLNLHVGS